MSGENQGSHKKQEKHTSGQSLPDPIIAPRSLQVVGSLKYAPERDIVHLQESFMCTILHRLQTQPCGFMRRFVESQRVTPKEIHDAFAMHARLQQLAVECPHMGLEEILAEAGYNQQRPEALIVLYFYMGVSTNIALLSGLRQAHDTFDLPLNLRFKRMQEALTEYLKQMT